MTERPILFSAPMVLALLAGTKTQTRRILKQPLKRGVLTRDVWRPFDPELPGDHATMVFHSPFGAPGDRLWVRETFSHDHKNTYPFLDIVYRADRSAPTKDDLEHCYCDAADKAIGIRNADCLACVGFKWKPSIFMRRKDSRLSLEVTDVRVQRLQEISPEDALAEGIVEFGGLSPGYALAGASPKDQMNDPRDAYRDLWESINGPGSWALNPWVWAVSFRLVAA